MFSPAGIMQLTTAAQLLVVESPDLTTDEYFDPDEIVYVVPWYNWQTDTRALRCHDETSGASVYLSVDPETSRCRFCGVDGNSGLEVTDILWLIGRMAMCKTYKGRSLGKLVPTEDSGVAAKLVTLLTTISASVD